MNDARPREKFEAKAIASKRNRPRSNETEKWVSVKVQRVRARVSIIRPETAKFSKHQWRKEKENKGRFCGKVKIKN